MSKAKIITTEVVTAFDDVEEGKALTQEFKDATSGMCRVLKFGARLWRVRENVSARGQVSGGRGKKDGLSEWLRIFAPDVTRPTAYRFLGIAEEIATDYAQIVGVRVAKQYALPELVTADPESLPKDAREKQLSLFDYVSGTSQRSWLDRFKPLEPRGGNPRKDDSEPKKNQKTPEQQREAMRERCNLLGKALRAIAQVKDYRVLDARELDTLNDLLTTLSTAVTEWRQKPLAEREATTA